MRQCGDCQLCCKLLPVKSLAKLAGDRCSHQKHHKGCDVYKQLGRVSTARALATALSRMV